MIFFPESLAEQHRHNSSLGVRGDAGGDGSGDDLGGGNVLSGCQAGRIRSAAPGI
jgi:hypothetical protein